jgi:hypothetical protein
VLSPMTSQDSEYLPVTGDEKKEELSKSTKHKLRGTRA